MTTLLTLIPELRHKILEHVILSPQPAPHSSTISLTDRQPNRTIPHKAWMGTSHVLYNPQNLTSLLPILLVNKQLHAETLSAISRLPSTLKHSYILDIIFYQENYLLPTWLFLPSLTTTVHKIHANIRYIELADPNAYNTAFNGGDGSPPRLYWMFYSLMETILLSNIIGKKTQLVSVKHVVIDIETPEDTPTMTNLRSQYEDEKRQARLEGRSVTMRPPKVYQPRKVVQAVRGGIIRLLHMFRDAKELGKILYECLDVFTVLVDGKQHREWKMGEILREMDGGSYGRGEEDDREEFRIWKEGVIERRRLRGLSNRGGEKGGW
jgi:hypothetical protein